MDNIILGLLLLSSRTIYQLRQRIDKGLNLIYSSSMGSIQSGIKKLLTCGYISCREIVENGKYKKIYSITDSGKQYFFDWINRPMEAQHSKNPELAKLYFMGFSDIKNRETNIKAYLGYLNEQYQILSTICEQASSVEFSKEHKDILMHQLACARYGRDLMKFHIEWYETFLKETRGERL